MSRRANRDRLMTLTDAELIAECACVIRAYRSLPRDSQERERASMATVDPWGECDRRGKLQLWRDALAQVKAEEIENARINQLPFVGGKP